MLLTPRLPKVSADPNLRIIKLGSTYGAKYFTNQDLSSEPCVVSGGVGEDITFDIEFINNYGGKVYLFDPTPRAVKHFQLVSEILGSSATKNYSENGCQIPESYELSKITPNNLKFFSYALLDGETKVKFYQPPDQSHVSYSVQNIQNSFRSDGPYIEVETIGAQQLLKIIGLAEIDILKLDIEGSEIYFLQDLFSNNIFPKQILFEIDELHFPSMKSRKIAISLFRLMKVNKYSLIHRAGFDFTYVYECSP